MKLPENKSNPKKFFSETFEDLEYLPDAPIEDNDQSLSIAQDFTEEKPIKKMNIKLTNAQPNLEVCQDKRKTSLKKLDYLMLESTEVFKHIDEDVHSEIRRIVPHNSSRVNSKFRDYEEADINSQSNSNNQIKTESLKVSSRLNLVDLAIYNQIFV